jgi:RNA polymerase-binding transcription factor
MWEESPQVWAYRGGMTQRSTHPGHLPDADLARLRAALTRRRDELVAAQQASEPNQRGVSDGREVEDGDVAERMIEQEAALRIGAFDANLLLDVERALVKMDEGVYGVSEESGVPIPLDRLEVMPWARRTAQEEDQRSRR